MMNGYVFHTPTKIVFGEGSINNLASIITKGMRHALLVTGHFSAIKYGYVERVRKQLEMLNIGCTHYGKISPNPKTEEIDDAVRLIADEKIDFVIGLGGGSALDAAKLIAAMFYVKGSTKSVLLGETALSNNRLPLIQIPTTSGTGSELSKGSIITDQSLKIKRGVRADCLFADIAIVDPELTYSLSLEQTMETGFDVITHAIETYFSRRSNDITEIYSIEALVRAFQSLLKLRENLQDHKARAEIAFSSMLMGVNLGNSSTCLPHRLQYPVGALTETSHPRGLASIYMSWLYYSMKYNHEKFDYLAYRVMNSSANDFYKYIEDFLGKIGMSIRLSDLGVTAYELPELVRKISGNLQDDPVCEEENVALKIYKNSL